MGAAGVNGAFNGQARGVMEGMMRSYWHVYMVDNDFVRGDIFRVFAQVPPPHASIQDQAGGHRAD